MVDKKKEERKALINEIYIYAKEFTKEQDYVIYYLDWEKYNWTIQVEESAGHLSLSWTP